MTCSRKCSRQTTPSSPAPAARTCTGTVKFIVKLTKGVSIAEELVLDMDDMQRILTRLLQLEHFYLAKKIRAICLLELLKFYLFVFLGIWPSCMAISQLNGQKLLTKGRFQKKLKMVGFIQRSSDPSQPGRALDKKNSKFTHFFMS